MNSTTVPMEEENSGERLRAFMKTHNLSLHDLAGLLRTTPQTLEDWLKDGLAPPASLLAFMILLETVPQAWSLFGVQSQAIRRYSDTPARSSEEALRRVRAI
jgi:transcriptional regulator with XRE-family HTH domain